jgi:hypothetical protein
MLPRSQTVLGLQVNQNVGATDRGGYAVLELVGDAVGLLQRRAGAELDVDVHVAL